MSTMSTTGLYDEDLHGTNPANLIDSEIQTLQVPGGDDYYFIIPKAAPYFADSMEVYNALTGDRYNENDDYLLGHYFIEAMESIGRPICGSIRFMKRTIQGQVRLRYRTIGGQWGFSDQAILAELSNRQNNPLIRSWAQIDVLPALFPPLEHTQPVNSLVGSTQILAALENLAVIMEAAAEGASQSHLTDYGNPHRTTAAQVQLGNVPNYAMATDQEATDGLRGDAFMSPRGVLLQLQAKAINPLNAHINQTGNVHGLVASDINLGNVPNFKKATAQNAVDITNDNTFMTPYTTSLLIEELSNLARVDELENLIKNHIADTNNPHHLTPQILGMYSNKEIDDKIAAVSQGGGDATTFGGKTPDQWADEFVSTVQGEDIVDKVTDQVGKNAVNIAGVITATDYTPADEEKYQRSLIGSAQAGYHSYMVINANEDFRTINGTGAPVVPDIIYKGMSGWASVKNATYVVDALGAIASYGSDAIAAPVGWNPATFNPANRCDAVWATANKVWMRKWVQQPTDGTVLYGDLYYFDASTSTPVLVVPANVGGVMIFTSAQHKYVGENTVIEKNGDIFEGSGPAAWVTAINAAIAAVQNAANPKLVIRETRIGDEYVIITTTDGMMNVYKMNRTGQAVTSLTKVANPTFMIDGVPTTSVGATTAVTGNFGHFAAILEDGRVAFFGDNGEGQAEVDSAAGPFLSVAAGHDFTVTVNNLHQTLYWGNSPDNSMLYGRRGISISTETLK